MRKSLNAIHLRQSQLTQKSMQRSDSVIFEPFVDSKSFQHIDLDDDVMKIFVDQNQSWETPLDLPRPSISRDESSHTIAVILESGEEKLDLNRESALMPDLEKSRQTYRNRYCYGLFSTRSRCLILVVPIIVVFLVIVGFFLFPRFPTITVGLPFAQDSKKGFEYNSTKDGTLTAISYDLSVNFSVASNNYWDFYTASILVNVKISFDLGKSTRFKSEVDQECMGWR